jgi:hypothetical protein
MRAATERYAKRLLADHLEFELAPKEFEHFQKLCRQANHDLLKNTLKELRGAAKAAAKAAKKGEFHELLPRIHRVYNRKLAEQHRLFPILSLFEASYRSFLAVWLEGHYGTSTWWQDLYDWLRKGNKATELSELNGVPTTAGVMRTVENLLRGVDGGILTGQVVPNIAHGQEMLRLSKMSDLEELSKEHWHHLRAALPSQLYSGAPLDAQVFSGMFRRLREARNDCFHHKEVPNRTHIASNAELLLDLIDIHIETEIDGAASAVVRPFSYQVPSTDRHAHGLSEPSAFFLQVTSSTDVVTRSVQARSRGEALLKTVEGLSVEDRDRLSALVFDDLGAERPPSTELV